MKKNVGVSLPQLPNEIVREARKTRLDAFAVALEGWRRGLKLKWYTKDSEHFKDMIIFGVNPPGRLFSLTSKERTHFFFRTRGDKVENNAVELAEDKGITKEVLQKKGVPVPKGRAFNEEATDGEIIEYSKNLPFPIVLKPTNASLGDGVVTNIYTNEAFLEALQYVRYDLGYKEVVVEQHVEGKEYRVYVIEDKVKAAYNRVPANITGDGIHTIEELINKKNLLRRKNARLNSCLIHYDNEIEDFIKEKGYDLHSVPKKGEYLLLREKTNVSTGGDPIDETDLLDDKIKQIAVDAVKAIPGLYHAGVDIILNETGLQGDPGFVIELNPTAQIGGALYPLSGEARDIPAGIIDYYFPETKHIDTKDSRVYFNMSTVLEPMENRSAMEVEVLPAPRGKIYARKYRVTGDVQRYIYQNWLKKEAIKLGLHGYIKNQAFDEMKILVAGNNLDAIHTFRKKIRQYPQGSNIKRIKSSVYYGQVEVGFEIAEDYNSSSLKSVQHALRRMERDLIRLERIKNRAEKDVRQIEESNSWKITEKLRRK